MLTPAGVGYCAADPSSLSLLCLVAGLLALVCCGACGVAFGRIYCFCAGFALAFLSAAAMLLCLLVSVPQLAGAWHSDTSLGFLLAMPWASQFSRWLSLQSCAVRPPFFCARSVHFDTEPADAM